ncbi:MAG TPA: aspartate/glutamate racemase family protein [Vineibacter sp.]|nr:aspartate/glutamate racemase family protein [Vineibacter sp.]
MFSQVNIVNGPTSIESAFDEALCAPGVVARVLEAEAEGVDAVIVDCFADPALEASREAVAIPVIGPGEAAMRMAASLGHRFGIVTVMDSALPLIDARARLLGLRDRLACIRSVNVPVGEIAHDRTLLLSRLVDAATEAVRKDCADTIVLGCTGFLGLSDELQGILHQQGDPVSVLSPLRTAVMWATMLLQLGLRHNAIAYPAPRAKPVTGFTLRQPAKVARTER